MFTDRDYALALQLQEQFNKTNHVNSGSSQHATPTTPNKIANLADPNLELKDPTPNVHDLFVNFNRVYFWGKLNSVAVRWSKRMYSCAGICRYHPRNGFCDIALSEPLLKLRPRKDLVETLLHEMIHAYLFLTNNDRDRDGHGPNFLSHMHRINKAANLNISVYHTFNDEVRLYQTHWWRCNGSCRNQRPYYGFVKRSSNRAPGPNDFWWRQHQFTCGGTFIKVKEPEKKQKATEKNNKIAKKPPSNIKGLKDLFNNSSSGKENNFNKTNGGVKNSSSTIVIAPKTLSDRKSTSTTSINQKTSSTNRNSTESILSFVTKTKGKTMASGAATIVGENKVYNGETSHDTKPVLETVRDSWLKRYSSGGVSQSNLTSNKRPSDTELYDSKSSKLLKLDPDKSFSPSVTVKTEKDVDNKCDIKVSSSLCKDQDNKFPEPSTSKQDDDKLSLFYSIPAKLLEDCNQIMKPLYGDSFSLNESHFKTSYPNSDLWQKAAEIDEQCKVQCPVCNHMYSRSKIEDHVNFCLENGPSTSGSSNYINLTKEFEDDFVEFKDVKPKIKHDSDFVIDLTDVDASFSDEKIIKKEENDVKTSLKVENETVDSQDSEEPSDYCNCPLCNKLLHRNEADDHLEQCVSMTFVDETMTQSEPVLNSHVPSNVGETIQEVDEEEEDASENSNKVSCPCCYKLFDPSEINSHLDDCLL